MGLAIKLGVIKLNKLKSGLVAWTNTFIKKKVESSL